MKNNKSIIKSLKYGISTFILLSLINPVFSSPEMKKGAAKKTSVTGQSGRQQFMDLQRIEKRAQKLENEIMSPCCFGGTLVTHSESSLTVEMKSKLRVFLKQGLTDEQVIDKMVNYYGKKMNLPPNEWQRIRATPKKEGFSLLAWILPITLSIAGIFLVSWIVHVFVSRNTAASKETQEEEEAINPDMEKRIEDELKDSEVS